MDIARVHHGLLRDLCLSSAPSLTECPLLRQSAGQMNRRRMKTKSHISELFRSSCTAVTAPNQHIPEPLNAECSTVLTKKNVMTVVHTFRLRSLFPSGGLSRGMMPEGRTLKSLWWLVRSPGYRRPEFGPVVERSNP